jgi:hypothetical protein
MKLISFPSWHAKHLEAKLPSGFPRVHPLERNAGQKCKARQSLVRANAHGSFGVTSRHNRYIGIQRQSLYQILGFYWKCREFSSGVWGGGVEPLLEMLLGDVQSELRDLKHTSDENWNDI